MRESSAEPGKIRIVALVSGNGTNLQALIDAASRGEVNASIALVVSSDPGAPALERAARAGIPAIAMPFRRNPGVDSKASRAAYDAALAETILPYKPDYVLLLGWMRILSGSFISRFSGAIVNLHPALPGAFPGTHAIERAWEACARGEIAETGVMTHFVPDECVDAGPVIALERVPLREGETLDELEARMHETEHALVIRTVRMLAEKSGILGKGV
jgi:phosphoribosylglycinamide formyltransferase-1